MGFKNTKAKVLAQKGPKSQKQTKEALRAPFKRAEKKDAAPRKK